ncbi:hypothetical protein DEO72_LG2g5843 [Vigna unguiculata]|uniref:Uncharacterized protein n=1 Tax=Vigna unguiculata TaxID=3917 RepID=A0A4D6LAC3_VIGUN|nr:hypothetical protein DEO72_LG2g5843 [Vigna unguiculata]
MKPYVAELIDKIEKLCNEGHQTKSVSVRIELLGVERWCEVKLRSFSDADQRTLGDLKDKWNTLGHTTRIPPERRRGEPIPHELLDRVLIAHTLR